MISVVNAGYMELLEAEAVAKEVYQMLMPFCELIHVAGSIRREESFIGDIEIVCLPKTVIHIKQEKYVEPIEQLDLFGAVKAESEKQLASTLNRFPESKKLPIQEFIDLVNSWEKIKGLPTGRYTQRRLPNKCKLDLFMPERDDYYRQLAIRTGSADYSHFVIARAWKLKGWCGTENGLRLITECEQKNNSWKCIVERPTLPPVWKSEKEFFDFIGVSYMTPKYRNITKGEIAKIRASYGRQ